jgi:hypothetical protein
LTENPHCLYEKSRPHRAEEWHKRAVKDGVLRSARARAEGTGQTSQKKASATVEQRLSAKKSSSREQTLCTQRGVVRLQKIGGLARPACFERGTMRVVQNTQMQLGEIDVSQIKFDLKSRDDIPKILRGLQHLYNDAALRGKLFTLLEAKIAPEVNKHNGRPGMTLWAIFVCGVVRLDLNIDYDRLHELLNQHLTLREMLGHGAFDRECYHYQTLKDNVSLFTPALLDEINQLVVGAGHGLLKKKENEALRGRCDSFVVETHVHYPTDINLLYDAMRKVITLTARWCEARGVNGWRQYQYNIRHLKRLMRQVQNTKRSKARSEQQQQKNAALIKAAHETYLQAAGDYLDKAKNTLPHLEARGGCTFDLARKLEIERFMQHAVRQISQTRRRVILGEVIAHEEKVFSIFEPHTEAFVNARRAHSAVESAINALEVHGLDRCPDHGIGGFERYVGLAVVARNIHRIGAILWAQEVKREQRKSKHANRAPPLKRAA